MRHANSLKKSTNPSKRMSVGGMSTNAKPEEMSERNWTHPGPESMLHQPPPYMGDAARISDQDVSEIVAAWDRKIPEGWPDNMSSNKSWPNLTFEFGPVVCHDKTLRRILRNREEQPNWHAKLFIYARNIPRLMQHGFYWSHANVVKGEERFYCGSHKLPGRSHKGALWRHTRVYQLRSLEGDEGGEWCGTLQVFGKTARTVLNFTLDDVTTESMFKVTAYNWEGELVYWADRNEQLLGNAIFDDMELPGWWPGLDWRGTKDKKG